MSGVVTGAIIGAVSAKFDRAERRQIATETREHEMAVRRGDRKSDQMHQDLFSTWVQLRHHELHEQMTVGQGEELTTIGVLLTNRTHGPRPWDTTMIATTGDLQLTEEDVALFRQIWSNANKLADSPGA